MPRSPPRPPRRPAPKDGSGRCTTSSWHTRTALTLPDLREYTRQLGLDQDRFSDDLDSRRFALRVARDVESADASGVAGTPTFFLNGRRHYGAYDLDSLTAAVRNAQQAMVDKAQ